MCMVKTQCCLVVCPWVLEAAGLRVRLVNARHVRNVPGRAKTGKKDVVWLTGRGLLARALYQDLGGGHCPGRRLVPGE
jgi:hypothetical protein